MSVSVALVPLSDVVNPAWEAEPRRTRGDGEILLAVPEDVFPELAPKGAGSSRLRMAGSLETAIITLRDRSSISICLLDEQLIGPAAGQMLHKVVAIAGEAPVIVLYENASSAAVSSYLLAGAAGVLPRHCLPSLLQWLAPTVGNSSGERDLQIDALPLSRREREVASMIAVGRSNKEIARTLDLQEVTVKVYASALFRKLGVRNRTEAAARLLSMGVGAS